MSAIESILEAYCVELDEVINIEEAHEAHRQSEEFLVKIGMNSCPLLQTLRE